MSRMPFLVSLTLGLLACSRVGGLAARPGSAKAERFCLPYPAEVLPTFEEMAGAAFAQMTIVVSPSGRRVAMTDQLGRVVAWEAVPGARPRQYPSYGTVQALFDSGGLYLLRGSGTAERLDLATGDRGISCPGRCDEPLQASELTGDDRRFVIAARRPAGPEGPAEIIALDECLISKLVRKRQSDCTPEVVERLARECGGPTAEIGPPICAGEQRRVAVLEGSSQDVQALGDELISSERRSQGADLETVVRDGSSGAEKRRWKQGQLAEIRAADGGIVEWSPSSGDVLVRDARTGAVQRRAEIFRGVPVATSCVTLESAGGRFMAFHSSCPESGPGSWVVFDARRGAVVWSSSESLGGVGVSAAGHVVTATSDGLCVTAAGLTQRRWEPVPR